MNAPKYIAAFLFVLLAVTGAQGQDLHYSMFDLSPMNLNPGTTGKFDGDYRFSANHRHQWRAVTIPYSTFSFGLDARDSGFWSLGLDMITGMIDELETLLDEKAV